MDSSGKPTGTADGHDSLTHEKGSLNPENLYESKLAPALIPFKGKAPTLKKQLTSNLTLSKLKRKNVDASSSRIDHESGGLGPENIETRRREPLKLLEPTHFHKDGNDA